MPANSFMQQLGQCMHPVGKHKATCVRILPAPVDLSQKVGICASMAALVIQQLG